MPIHAPAQPRVFCSLRSRQCSGLQPAAQAALAGLLLFPATGMCAPQAAAPTTPTVPHSHVRAKAKPAPATPAAETLVAAPAPPAAPPLPDWPANDKPAPATVVWDSQGLRIDATNSSLQQILSDVSMDTGAKVEGLRSDERVFGTYGPGRASDVLSQLLNGSGYNVLMIGDQGAGTPRQIVLSARSTGGATQVRNERLGNNSEEDLEAEQEIRDQEMQQQQLLQEQMQRQQQQLQQQVEPPNIRNGFQPTQPGQPPRTPQQIMQQMQQEQQQQQQAPQNPQ